ncbi:MAG: multi-sensor hybrid histidine kinase, partial [Candidatus Binatus sp.]|nr:multi-sensor hybrid histidine kinase [Candidatus Binatus sp.]
CVVCMVAWGVGTYLVPGDDMNSPQMWLMLIAAALFGEACVYIRQDFARDNLAANRKLQESEARMRKVLSASPNAVSIIRERDLQLREVFGRGLSKRVSALIGAPISEADFYRHDPRVAEILATVREKGDLPEMEIEYLSVEGVAFPCLVSAQRLKIDDEWHIVSFMRDLSDLKHAQRQIEESERKYRAIFDALNGIAGIYLLIDGRFVDSSEPTNQSVNKLNGYSLAEMMGKTIDDLNLWVDPNEKREAEMRIARDGHLSAMEARSRRKDGTEFPALLSMWPMEIKGEQGMLIIVLNISNSAEYRRKLAESQSTLGKVFDACTDSMMIFDADTLRIAAVNEEFFRLSGYSRAEAVGTMVGDLKLWTDPLQEAEFGALLVSEGEVRSFDALMRSKGGHEVSCLISAASLEFEGRRCYLSTTRDISAIKEAQRELIEARETALSASHAKSDFLSSMSHEIRTPMNSILGMAELLSETQLNEEQRRFLEVMSSNGNVLLELINSILDLAKIESGRLLLETTDFNLPDLVAKTLATFEGRAGGKGLRLTAWFAPDAPENLIGDPLRLRQVLINLIGNALKFTELGEVTLLVEPDLEARRPGCLRFTVADTGIGIAPANIESIFSKFSQADSSVSRKYGGSGLGLAIAERLVGLMGGKIWVTSELDKGSKFFFTVECGVANTAFEPISMEDPVMAPISAAVIEGSGDRPATSILVAEDSPDNRLLIAAYLRAANCKIAFAENGRRAFEMFTAGHYDLVLMDIQMPIMDGYAATGAIRSWEREHHALPTRIVALTASALSEDVARALAAGCDSHVSKPVKKATLLRLIRESADVAADAAA